jgi:hypothetical protein
VWVLLSALIASSHAADCPPVTWKQLEMVDLQDPAVQAARRTRLARLTGVRPPDPVPRAKGSEGPHATLSELRCRVPAQSKEEPPRVDRARPPAPHGEVPAVLERLEEQAPVDANEPAVERHPAPERPSHEGPELGVLSLAPRRGHEVGWVEAVLGWLREEG